MSGLIHYLEGFIDLQHIENRNEQKAAWRKAMATLATLAFEYRPVPLEGIHPKKLLQSTQVALQEGWFDDLSWLSAPAAAVTLYQLSAALPGSTQRQELGKRTLQRLNNGNAATNIAVATVLAQSSPKNLHWHILNNRIRLAMWLPIGLDISSDALAIALISRRDLVNKWFHEPSTGSLASRCLSARVLERSAREAARRYEQGDDGAIRIFAQESICLTWKHLLDERESLVWRHAAVARGLLSKAIPSYSEEIRQDLDPNLSPTEWRRAAVSLISSLAVRPHQVLQEIKTFLESPCFTKDQGLAGAMLMGFPRAAETEPDISDMLLNQLLPRGSLYALQMLAYLLSETTGLGEFGRKATEYAYQALQNQIIQLNRISDDGEAALVESLYQEFANIRTNDSQSNSNLSLNTSLQAALNLFLEKDTKSAYQATSTAVSAARKSLNALYECDLEHSHDRKNAYKILHDLDKVLLESDMLSCLLSLKTDGSNVATIKKLQRHLADWLINHEQEAVVSQEITHLTFRMKRMITLLHLVDSDISNKDGNSKNNHHLIGSTRILLRRIHNSVPSPLQRVVCATLARAGDALFRNSILEASDLLVAITYHTSNHEDIHTIGEASMLPDLEQCLNSLSELAEQVNSEAKDDVQWNKTSLEALRSLIDTLPVASSPRLEAMRIALLQLFRGLIQITKARSLSDLVRNRQAKIIDEVEDAVHQLTQITAGAIRRLGIEPNNDGDAVSCKQLRSIGLSIERAINDTRWPIELPTSDLEANLSQEISSIYAKIVVRILLGIKQLPISAPHSTPMDIPMLHSRSLPNWIPPHRTLGGFFVLHAIGSSGRSSVLVAKRVDERHLKNAEKFALKVPSYDGGAARHLSEEEFFHLFREEAGALLALPHDHPNLASFVTFDARARPKPILVMELIEGITLSRFLERGHISSEQAIQILKGIANGLQAMHELGIGHLDIKPSNIILRSGKTEDNQPVLVDFGLSGRRLRPGCATPHYGAPEVWGLTFDDKYPDPRPADVYAFACVAYECLLGTELFNGESEMALISAHITHDGLPSGIDRLAKDSRYNHLIPWFQSALRSDPKQRTDIQTLRLQMDQWAHARTTAV